MKWPGQEPYIFRCNPCNQMEEFQNLLETVDLHALDDEKIPAILFPPETVPIEDTVSHTGAVAENGRGRGRGRGRRGALTGANEVRPIEQNDAAVPENGRGCGRGRGRGRGRGKNGLVATTTRNQPNNVVALVPDNEVNIAALTVNIVLPVLASSPIDEGLPLTLPFQMNIRPEDLISPIEAGITFQVIY